MTRSIRTLAVALTLGMIAATLVALIAAPASAQMTAINSANRGWYRAAGQHPSTNYAVGVNSGTSYHDFFSFDLSGVPANGGDITAATFTAVNPSGGGAVMAFNLREVTTAYATVNAAQADGATGAAIYTDLGDGNLFGTTTPATMATSPISVDFNSVGISALNIHRGGNIVIGGSLTNPVDGQKMFLNTDASPASDIQLTLTIKDSTHIALKGPARARAGSSVTVSGTLTSNPDNASCTGSQLVTMKAGNKTSSKSTAVGGLFSFNVKILKKTIVKVSYAGTADCQQTTAQKTIRLKN